MAFILPERLKLTPLAVGTLVAAVSAAAQRPDGTPPKAMKEQFPKVATFMQRPTRCLSFERGRTCWFTF